MNQQALVRLHGAGGRVFASHFHYAWFDTGPFGSQNLATWTPGDSDIGNIDTLVHTTTLPNGQPFPKGQALAQWLGNVGALHRTASSRSSRRGTTRTCRRANTPSQPWIVADSQREPAGATRVLLLRHAGRRAARATPN